jgi:hypothetical protein
MELMRGGKPDDVDYAPGTLKMMDARGEGTCPEKRSGLNFAAASEDEHCSGEQDQCARARGHVDFRGMIPREQGRGGSENHQDSRD